MASDHIEQHEPGDPPPILASVFTRPLAPASAHDADGLGPDARKRIGRHLRHLYAEVLAQPLPPRFATLLDALASQGAAQKTGRRQA